MVHIIDTEKREIRVPPPDQDTTIEQVRAHIDKLYKGTEIADYNVVFQPPKHTVNTSNALYVPPETVEYRMTNANHITDY